MPFLGFGEDGFGVIFGGYDTGDDNSPIPIAEGATVLFDPDSPNFLVKIHLRVAGAKPVDTSLLTGPYVEFMSHFWLMNETVLGAIADVTGNNPGETTTGVTIAAAEFGTGLVATGLVAGQGVSIPSVSLIGKWSLEWLSNTAGAGWVHTVITNDPENGQITYHNGVEVSTAAYQTTPRVFNNLFQLDGALVPNQILEYVRTWDMALDGPLVAALHLDPYLMFGVNQDLLNEIRIIVNFMKPIRSQWRFVYL